MIKILKLNPISNLINNVFDEKYSIVNECDNPELIIVRSAQMADYKVNENLLAVGRAGAGVNNIPFADYAKLGVVVFNTPGANANAVKELVIFAMLASGRSVYEGINWVQSLKGKGEEVKTLVEKGKGRFVGHEICGKTLGIIGLGAIGRLVADSVSSLGVKIIGYDPFIGNDVMINPAVNVTKDLDEIFASCDFISVHTPYLPSTKGFINKDSIAKMKNGVVLINCARGELIVNDDVIEAINSGKIHKYFTDFPTDDLLGIENIIPCPHLGASTPEAEDNCAVMVANQLKDYYENGNIKNSVNFPALSAERDGNRITILTNGNPAVAEKAQSIILSCGININKLSSAVKGESGYIIMDTAQIPSSESVEKIEKIEGVFKVRLFQ